MSRGEEKFVDARLGELREAMREHKAPASVERIALAAFRQHVPRQHAGSAWLRWASAGAAFVVLLTAVAYSRLDTTDVPPPVPVIARMSVPDVHVARAARVEAPRPKPRRGAVLAARKPVRRQEVATEFIPLPYAPPMTGSEAAQVIRVGLPRSAMRTFGFPVTSDRLGERVPADVLLGEDGVARAVRFVKTSR